MSLAPGSRLGPYEVSAALGAGGMGEVWRARDSRLQRDVAIKTLPAGFAEDAGRMARFQREAQVLAALSHPNIAAIYGLEEAGGARALVMELVEGQTLAERIAAGPIPLDEALAIARQIAAALEAAHEKGVVHRDLKPANIKLTPEGKVKVLDFGLAKALDAEASSGDPAHSPTLTLDATRAGVILGTAGYMSPEQARGKAVDKRADIWAFGVVLYEMLTGRMMFEGETVSDTLAGVLRGEIDWQPLPAETPQPLRRLLARCLERDPKRRLRDIGDAWFEIDTPAASPVARDSRPPGSGPRKLLPWLGAAALAAAGIAWGLLHTPALPPQPVSRWTSIPAQGAVGVSLSRDGTRLAYMDFSSGAPTISLRALDQLEAKQVPGTDSGYFATFSPDNQWFAFVSGALNEFKLKKIPVNGGTSITLCEHVMPMGLYWGDDDMLVFTTPKGLMRVSSAGGTPETLTTVDSKKNETAHRWPSYLPGNRGVLFSIQSGSTSQVAVLDLKTHSYRALTSGSRALYVPTGHLVFYRGSTLFTAPFNPRRMEITGPEAPAVENVANLGGIDAGDYAVADSGLLVYMRGSGTGGKTVLNWADRKGVTQPVSDAQQWGTGRLSPDGSKIANSIHASNRLSGDLWVYDLERRTPTRLTFEGLNENPVWTRDGRWITFGGAIQDKHGIYRVAADASGKPELLAETDSRAVPHSWSPDGKTLVYSATGPDKRIHLWGLAWPGGKPSQLHEAPFTEIDGEVSPDGRWLAYQSDESGVNEIYVQPFPGPGAKTRISTQGGISPRWSHSGKELFYWGGTPTSLMAVDVQGGATFRAGIPQALFRMQVGTTWDVAPDGKRFLVEINEITTSGRRLDAVVNWFDELRRHKSP